MFAAASSGSAATSADITWTSLTAAGPAGAAGVPGGGAAVASAACRRSAETGLVAGGPLKRPHARRAEPARRDHRPGHQCRGGQRFRDRLGLGRRLDRRRSISVVLWNVPLGQSSPEPPAAADATASELDSPCCRGGGERAPRSEECPCAAASRDADPSRQGDDPADEQRLEGPFDLLHRSAGNRAVARLVGTLLPPSTRIEMEGLFDRSFADVRIHESGAAERRGTEAFTTGNDIEFAGGAFAPESEQGRRVLAHELSHVVQQDGKEQSGREPERLRDTTLEQEAGRVGERAAARASVSDLPLSRVGAAAPVAQHFEEEEHKAIGNEATGGRGVDLAPGYSVSYGEMVAMAGDHFESIDQMRELASKPAPGAGTREELEYVRWVKVNDVDAMKPQFSEEARDAADKRYYRLAANNPSHFLAPGKGDSDRSVADRSQDVKTETRMDAYFPYRVENVAIPQNAVAGYHMNHVRAIGEAVAAGQSKTGIERALATEAFSNHFLTDSFSSGHARTERRSAFDYWNEKVPMFRYNLAGYLGQKLAEGLSGTFTEAKIYKGHMPFNWAGTHKKVDSALNEKGVALSFGHVGRRRDPRLRQHAGRQGDGAGGGGDPLRRQAPGRG